MLSLPNDGRHPTLELDPQQRRQKTLEALAAQLQALAQAKPVLMIFEDVHWIDPTSLEAVGRMVDRLRTLGVLLIVTYRPEFEPPWIGRPHVTALTLNRLGEREITAMIDRVTGNKALPESVRQDIMERTDGVPLFVEEMTKAVLEAESEGEARHTAATVPSSAVAVPASLHASLMARLDRLGPAKEIAQIGAAIGREFSHLLLEAVVRKSPAELQSTLDRLIQAGLLFRQGVPPHSTYLFKHALVQDAAYGTLLREPRRELHARIAHTIERQFAEIAESQPELVARHCTEAGLIEKAAGLWGKAGQRSSERSALVEAVAQLSRALDLIASLPATPSLRRQQIELQVALITPIIHIKGHAAAETKAAAERARLLIEQAEALGEAPDDPLLIFSVLYGLWSTNAVAFNGDALRELAMQLLALAHKQGTTAARLVAHRAMGISLVYTGDLIEAREHLEQTIALYDPAEHRPLATRFVTDPRVHALSYRSWTLLFLGKPDAALVDAERAVIEARKIGQAAVLMNALTLACFSHTFCRRYPAATNQLDELVALADEKGSLYWKALGMLLRGCVLAGTGKAAECVSVITTWLSARRSTGSTSFIPFWSSHLAMAHAQLGEFSEAMRCIAEATTALKSSKERWFEAEVHRIAGDIALMSPQPDAAKAEGYYNRALAVTHQQQAKSWELRAATSLARLWRDQGKVSEARELLAPVYGWFTEGFDTRDLKEAKALLEELAT